MDKSKELQKIIDSAKKSIESIKILGDKEWKSERARQALVEIAVLEKKLKEK